MANTSNAPVIGKGFWVGATAILLFMLVGVAGYLVSVSTPLESMEPDQRAFMSAMPAWQTPVYAIAVWSGLAGAILLLMRRRWSVPALLLSLVGAIGTFLPFAIVPEVRNLAGAGQAIPAVIVISLCAASLWFARHAQQRGWLR